MARPEMMIGKIARRLTKLMPRSFGSVFGSSPKPFSPRAKVSFAARMITTEKNNEISVLKIYILRDSKFSGSFASIEIRTEVENHAKNTTKGT